MAVELIETAQPHFIPGYTGFCPQYQYRCGDTYGHITHKLLLDPSVPHSERLILSDRATDTYQTFRPPARDIDIVNARFREGDIYKQPAMPGYEGFVPRERGKFGQRYTVQVSDAITEFEKQRLVDEEAKNQLIKTVALQDGKWEPQTIEDRQQVKTNTKMPLCEVRPELSGIVRHVVCDDPPLQISPLQHQSPLFSETNNKDKYCVKGFTGHIPYGYSHFGMSNLQMTKQALCEFTSNYRRRESTEWAPISIVRTDPQLLIQPTEIYHKHIGQVPNYTGHIPGAEFRCGKTYGNDTIDSKRWLRGDFSL